MIKSTNKRVACVRLIVKFSSRNALEIAKYHKVRHKSGENKSINPTVKLKDLLQRSGQQKTKKKKT